MRLLLLLWALAGPAAAFTLDEVAAIAEVMVDGDLAKRIQTPRSLAKMVTVDPRDEWAPGDNYAVDHASFLRMKKTLVRLARLCPSACDVNLWKPVPGLADRIQILVRNVNEMSQFWPWGALHQKTPPEMRRVLETGRRELVRRRPGMTSVLAPVSDSLGDVVALVEVVSQDHPDPQENVK